MGGAPREPYYDPATIKKHGKYVRMWELQDFKQREKDSGALSMRALEEYDCEEERTRALYSSGHSERMAGGEILISDDSTQNWLSNVPKDSVAAAKLKLVCK